MFRLDVSGIKWITIIKIVQQICLKNSIRSKSKSLN